MALGLRVDITPEFDEISKDIEGRLKRTNQGFTKDVLDEIELTQIQAYTLTSMPAQPPGSTYRRTFTLRESSRRRIGTITANRIDASWFTKLDYAAEVLGEVEDQKEIHRGRWKSLQEVVKLVDAKIPDIYDENFRKAE